MSESLALAVRQDVGGLSPGSVVIATQLSGEELAADSPAWSLGGERLRGAARRGETRGALYELTLFHSDGAAPGLAVMGAGSRRELDPVRYARIASAASRILTGRGYAELAWLDDEHLPAETLGRAVAEGAIRGAYNSELLKSSAGRRRTIGRLDVVSRRDSGSIEAGMSVGRAVGESSGVARDLTNLPSNQVTPLSLAWQAEELAARWGFDVEVIDENRMDELGMGSFLSVAAGSALPPRLIHARFGPDDAATRLAFVGKGLTFDSGGLHIKPIESMRTMKHDMAGAAAALLALATCARLGVSNIRVDAYLGAVENMIGPAATRAGDVVTACNGKTIEIVDPDSEGRLVLADVLAYAVAQGATHLVDIATLTLGAHIALGSAATLAAGRPQKWVEKVAGAAAEGLERAWPMPILSEHRQAMDSDIADLRNSGGREGSALNAGAFLREFVGEVPWAHLDIAATSWTNEAHPYQPKGATAAGLGTLVQLALTMDAEAAAKRSA